MFWVSFLYPAGHIITVTAYEKKAEGYTLMIYCPQVLLKRVDSLWKENHWIHKNRGEQP
jgi:hypothetical protein